MTDAKGLVLAASAVFAAIGALGLFMLGALDEEIKTLRPRIQLLEQQVAVHEEWLQRERCDGG